MDLIDFLSNCEKRLNLARQSPYYKKSKFRLEDVKELILKDKLTLELAELYAEESIKEFFNCLREFGGVLLEDIHTLTEMATYKDLDISNKSTQYLYGKVILHLKASFRSAEDEIYLQIFPILVEKGAEVLPKFKDWLNTMQISKENFKIDLYKKYFSLINSKQEINKEKLKKIFLFSRATIGADALISSALINRIVKEVENAEIILIDASNIGHQIFNIPMVRTVKGFINKEGKEISFKWNRNNASFLGRLEYSMNVSEYIKTETKELDPKEYFIIDFDTRLSQTGILPIDNNGKHHFIKDSYEEGSTIKSLGQMSSDYLNNIFGGSEKNFPRIEISSHDRKLASEIWDSLKLDSKKVAITSFTEGKGTTSLSRNFEKEVTFKLLEQGITPFIERSPNKIEDQKNLELVNSLKEKGKKITEIMVEGKEIFLLDYDKEGEVMNKESLNYTKRGLEADIYTFNTTIGILTGLIERSMASISYNSKNQHISAAVNVPFITISTGYPNEVYLKRWAPFSRNFSRIIDIDKKGLEYLKNENFRKECDELAINRTISAINELNSQNV